MSAPRAVVVCAHAPFPVISGGRKRTVRLLEAMQRAGAIPHIVTHDQIPEAEPEARERGWGYEVIPPPVGTLRNRFRQHVRSEAAPHSAAMADRLRELAADAAFMQFEEIGSAQYVHAVPSDTSTIVSLYNVDSAVFRDAARLEGGEAQAWRSLYRVKRMERTERHAARRANAVLAVSDHDRAQFAKWRARQALLVPNGVDRELFGIPAGVPPGERVLFFGQFGWRPNVAGLLRYLTEAWPRVAAARPHAELRIAGPSAKQAVREAASAQPRVEVLGFVDDLLAELATARVTIAPLWVGGGTRIKVLEAMAAARPVIGTTIGVEQIGFEHDRHGLVADTPEGLAEATVSVLAEDGLATRLGAEARQLAQGYRWETTTAPAEQLYRDAVAGRL
ncbi:MAG: polysaccharide biosynthesis protein PslH [Solirubrobacteraceae bacterium]